MVVVVRIVDGASEQTGRDDEMMTVIAERAECTCWFFADAI